MKFSKRLALGLIALAMVVASLGMTPRAHAATSTLNPPYTSVQLFKWSWNDIATECTQFLGPQGYGGVQISPPMAAVKDGYWYGMYQPVNYKVLTSQMGTQAELQTMINTCHTAGVRVYADIVTNQMAGGSSSSGTSTDGSTWDSNSLTYPDFSSSDFHTKCSIADTDYNDTTGTGTYNVQHCWLEGMPDLATENADVQTKIENYMNLLISLGVDGFRMDAAKHQQEDQLAIIFAAVKTAHPKTLEGEDLFVTQEITPDAEVNRASYEALGTLNEFQFTYAMRDALRQNSSQSLSSIPIMMGTPDNWGGSSGFLPSASAQLFINNWDTERDDNATDSLNASNYTGDPNDASSTYRYDLANIFMLAQPYGAMVQVQSGFRFTDANQDMPTTGAFVSGVAQVPTSRTTTSGWDFIHRWPDIANMVAFRTATNGLDESNRVTGTSNQVAFSRGNVGFVALNNDTAVWQQTFQTGLPAGTYCNVVNGILSTSDSKCTADTVTVDSSGNAVLSIPANGGSVVPAVAIYTGQVQTTAASSSPYSTMYLRGDLTSWTAPGTAMTLVSNDTWQTSVTLTAATTYSYKFDASGTWATGQAWGSSITPATSTTSGVAQVDSNTNLSFTPTTTGTYVLSFNDKTLAYSVTAPAPSSQRSTMYVRGDMNSWGATAMTLVSSDTWQATVTLSCTTCSYKYDAVSGSWPTGGAWGDSGTAGLAEVDTNNNLSYTPVAAGDYVFTFNDSTLAYSVAASTTAPVVPSVPTGLTATAVSAAGINLTWTASTGATSYNVYRSTSKTGPFTTSVGTPTTNSYSDTGLTASTTYYYEVAAVNSAGTSANTAVVSAATSAPSAYTSPYSTMYLRGGMNSWGSTAMTLVANDTWQYTATLTPNTAYQFKFDASGSWTTGEQWGDSGTSGLAEVNSNNNINFTTGTGAMYLFSFNDSTLAYSVTAAITPSFTIAVAPNVLFVTAGESNTTTVTLTPVNGFDPTSSITLACSGLPTGVTCSFSPTTVDTAGNINSTLTVNASTSANTSGALRMKSHPFLPGSALAFAVCFMGWKKRRGVLPVLLVLMSVFGMALFTGCSKGARPITPAISTITVTATSNPTTGAVKQTATFTIAVQQ